MLRASFLAIGLLCTQSAFAGGIAIIDFQRAVTETNEGKAAQSKIDTMYQTRKGEIDRMQQELEKEVQDYQARAMILSEQARAEAEQQLLVKQQRFQQTTMQYETELQQTYGGLLQDLDEKMRTMSSEIAKQKGYDLVLDRAVVVYSGGEVVDMTTDLVARYNAANPK